jgi:hypothetical protein
MQGVEMEQDAVLKKDPTKPMLLTVGRMIDGRVRAASFFYDRCNPKVTWYVFVDVFDHGKISFGIPNPREYGMEVGKEMFHEDSAAAHDLLEKIAVEFLEKERKSRPRLNGQKPFFFKQWGEFSPCQNDEWHGLGPTGKPKQSAISPDGKLCGGFIGEEYARQMELEGWRPIQRIGKVEAGRLLDGVPHDAMPEQEPEA